MISRSVGPKMDRSVKNERFSNVFSRFSTGTTGNDPLMNGYDLNKRFINGFEPFLHRYYGRYTGDGCIAGSFSLVVAELTMKKSTPNIF